MAPRYFRTCYEESILQTTKWSSSFKAECCLLTVVLPEPREFLVRFSHPAMRGALDGGLPLSEVAASSLALTELITSLWAANRSFGADAVMPTVRVAAGSVDFLTTGPSLIGGGLGLLDT